MTSIVIAGRPNSELTSHCILLGENLKQNFPDIYVIVVLKHPDEWDSYSEEVKLFLIVSYQTCLDSERFFTPMYINLMES